MAKRGPISSLILEELYSAGDDALLNLLQTTDDLKPALPIVKRWASDNRPWAKRALATYLASAGKPNDRLLIKRLFKAAWHSNDPAALAPFVVQFDRYIRRSVVVRRSWDRDSRTVIETDALRLIPRGRSGPFSTPTAHYLRRRAWRYFRRLGFQQPQRYVPAVARWLAGYEDADVASGVNLLDNWSLVHACFGKSPVLEFTARHTAVRESAGLSQLAPAPMFERLWQLPDSFTPLLDLLTGAQSRVVRVWCTQMLRRHHLDRASLIDPERLLQLLQHDDDELQAFAADLLANMPGVDKWPVERWLVLLQTRNITALETIASQFSRHVLPDRVTLAQVVSLALSPASPVATLGLELLSARSVRTPADRAIVSTLAGVTCAAHATDLATWAMSQIGIAGAYSIDPVTPFFDAPLSATRAAAIAWLVEGSPGYSDSELYARLLETPYDDVRKVLLGQLELRSRLPGATTQQVSQLWTDVLLNIHRGGRLKLAALRRISQALRDRPDDAVVLLPIVAVAIRSVRPPEARAGLSAVVDAVERQPALSPLVARLLPELVLSPEGAAA